MSKPDPSPSATPSLSEKVRAMAVDVAKLSEEYRDHSETDETTLLLAAGMLDEYADVLAQRSETAPKGYDCDFCDKPKYHTDSADQRDLCEGHTPPSAIAALPEANELVTLTADARRFRALLKDPVGARHLLHLLQQGKGDEAAFRSMIDRIDASREAAHGTR